MAKKMPDITGQRFGKLVASAFHGKRARGNAWTLCWLCLCDCGGEKIASRPDLLAGRVISCGCRQGSPTHRHTKTPGYHSYRSMVERCTNPQSKDYPRYGARGIRVCARWLRGDGSKAGIECFFDDMGQMPSAGHSVDRKNNNLGYEPTNCRWATAAEQARNTRRNYFSDGRDVAAFLKERGIKYGTFRQRVASGWSVSEASTVPTNAFRNPEAVSGLRRAQASARNRDGGRFS